MNEVVIIFALKLMFVTDIREDESSAVIQFKCGGRARLSRDDAKYADFLDEARSSREHCHPVAVTVAKPDRIVAIKWSGSDTVLSVKESGADRLEVWFAGHAAKYFLRKDNPDFRRVRAALERSAKEQSLVWLSFDYGEKVIVDALPVEQKANGGARP